MSARIGKGVYGGVNKSKEFETWEVRYHEEQRWCWCSAMVPEEVLMIKIFDSEVERAQAVAHGGFPLLGQVGPPRQSIEVRCLVFWEG